MSKADEEPMKAFLRGLDRLTKKTGVAIGGCGCFGSPWLATGGKVEAENLVWLDKEGRYSTD